MMMVLVTDFSSSRHKDPYFDEEDYDAVVEDVRSWLPICLEVYEVSDECVDLSLRRFMYDRGTLLDDVVFNTLTYHKED